MTSKTNGSMKSATETKSLVIRGIPQEFTIDDIADYLEDQLNVKTAYIELQKDDKFKFRGSLVVKPSSKKEASRLLRDNFYCEDQLLHITRENKFVSDEKEEKPKRRKRVVPVVPLERKKDAILQFSGLKDETTSFTDLKKPFNAYEEVAWASFLKGRLEGHIRFANEGGAQKLLDIIQEKGESIVVNESELQLNLVTGPEEEEQWKQAEIEIARRKKQWVRRRYPRRPYNGQQQKQQKTPEDSVACNEDDGGRSDDVIDQSDGVIDSSPEKVVNVEEPLDEESFKG